VSIFGLQHKLLSPPAEYNKREGLIPDFQSSSGDNEVNASAGEAGTSSTHAVAPKTPGRGGRPRRDVREGPRDVLQRISSSSGGGGPGISGLHPALGELVWPADLEEVSIPYHWNAILPRWCWTPDMRSLPLR